jgi:hypothetical protein
MIKRYIFFAVILCSFATNSLIASQESRRLFFDKSTQGIIRASSMYYVGAYSFVWSSTHLFNVATLSYPSVEQANRQMCRGLLKTMPITAPVWFCSAIVWHKLYQHSDEQRAASIKKRLEMAD